MTHSLAPLVSADAPTEEAVIILEEHLSLSDLEQELELALSSRADRLALDFRLKAGHPFTAVDAYRLLLDQLPKSARLAGSVTVHVSSDKIAQRLTSLRVPDDAPARKKTLGGVTVTLYGGSILDLAADALVNASNRRLVLGSGVSGALRRACGPKLQEAMSRIGGVTSDSYAVTPAFEHGRVREIIHVPSVSGSEAVITQAYRNVLGRAVQAGHARVLVPALGAGVGGMPFEATALALRRAIEACGEAHDLEIVVTLIDSPALDAFARVFDV
jgi:O-acetyl-ADP-ribose deacetylase